MEEVLLTIKAVEQLPASTFQPSAKSLKGRQLSSHHDCLSDLGDLSSHPPWASHLDNTQQVVARTEDDARKGARALDLAVLFHQDTGFYSN